jgi:flavin-dependent thymidylate synthase
MLEVTLRDVNLGAADSIIDALSVCRNKPCTEKTLYHCLDEKPTPHLSTLEFTWFNFYVKGLSVKARIQLLRHRLFSNMERSTRHINMSEAKCIIPKTVKNKEAFEGCYDAILGMYKRAIAGGETEEDAAYLLPLGIETEFFIAGNGRVFYEFINKRLCKRHVQDEHYRFANAILNELIDHGLIFFKEAIPCKSCGKCLVYNLVQHEFYGIGEIESIEYLQKE